MLSILADRSTCTILFIFRLKTPQYVHRLEHYARNLNFVKRKIQLLEENTAQADLFWSRNFSKTDVDNLSQRKSLCYCVKVNFFSCYYQIVQLQTCHFNFNRIFYRNSTLTFSTNIFSFYRRCQAKLSCLAIIVTIPT